MKESIGNIFYTDCDAVCITTNGFVKSNDENVMGRGCALEAKKLIPDLPLILGEKITNEGNQVHILLEQNDVHLISFPVKPITVMCNGSNVVEHMNNKFKVGSIVPGWAAKADIEIIRQSALELVQLANEMNWKTILLPRPGCGAGELSWNNLVKPVLEEILDDRFICMTFKSNTNDKAPWE